MSHYRNIVKRRIYIREYMRRYRKKIKENQQKETGDREK